MTKNFSVSEFECSCGCAMPSEVKDNIQKLCVELQELRDFINKPIKINSGYRCENYNDNIIKGAKYSQHKLGKAADIVVSGLSASDVYNVISDLIDFGALNFGGLGKYDSFTHVDIRGNSARWDYSRSNKK